MTPEEEKLVQARQELNLVKQDAIIYHVKVLSAGYILIFLLGCAIVTVLWDNRTRSMENGERLERLIEAVKESKEK